MCEQIFDPQPLLKANFDSIIEKVGFLKIVDSKNLAKQSAFIAAKIYLTAGKQNNDKMQSGFGLNHIYYKHFNEIPSRFHIINAVGEIDYVATIVSFIKYFLNQATKMTEIRVYHEENHKPLLIRSPLGAIVLAYNSKFEYYTVTTYSKFIKPRGQLKGFLASTLDF